MSQQDARNLIELAGVSKSFREPLANPFRRRKTIRALDEVGLSLPRREITCLLGPNGAGKTTLIKILASLIEPDSGSILYGGEALGQCGPSLRGRIGLVTPNERSFYWRLSCAQNLEFFGTLYGLRGRRLSSRIDAVIEATGIAKERDRPYRLCSSGARQKLNLARALLGEPELYLLDEPAAQLDPMARAEFRAFVAKELVGERGATVFLCTHDLEEAELLADSIVVLDRGRVVAAGRREELREAMGFRPELELRYAGEPPAGWLEAEGSGARLLGPGALRLGLDGEGPGGEELLRSFVLAGGALLEAYAVKDSLYSLLERRTGPRA